MSTESDRIDAEQYHAMCNRLWAIVGQPREGKPCDVLLAEESQRNREAAQMWSERAHTLENALKPFVKYAIAHGAVTLLGHNGARLMSEDWIRAHEAMMANNEVRDAAEPRSL